MTVPPAQRIAFTMPFPPRELSPNARNNWYPKAAKVRAYRQSCKVDALNVRREHEAQGMTFPLATPATLLLTFVLTTRQRRDLDNLVASFKAGLDGLVDAGLIVDDDAWKLRLGVEVELGEKQLIRVRLEGAGA